MKRIACVFVVCLVYFVANAQDPVIVREVGSSDPAFTKLDEFMIAYMKNYGIKAGAFAVAKNGKIVYAKAFTNAPSNYPLTLPTSLFRIASVSKPITALAIRKLIEDSVLRLDTPIQKILQYELPAQDAKPAKLETEGYYFSKIKLQHLLLHTAGFRNGFATYKNDQVVANAYNGGKLPITKYMTAQWGAKQKQYAYPGSDDEYSNYGFMLLGIIIEKVTHENYIDAIRKMFFRKLGIVRPKLSLSKESQRYPGEVLYHVIPKTDTPCVVSSGNCPIQYGGENAENRDSYGGWVMSPVDYVRLLAAYRTKHPALPKVSPVGLLSLPNKPTISTKGIVFDHGGTIPGSWAYMAIRKDSVDFMVTFNTTCDPSLTFKYGGETYTAGEHPTVWHSILDGINNWPAYDLTPAYFGQYEMNEKTKNLRYDIVWNESTTDAVVERAKSLPEFNASSAIFEKRGYRLQSVNSYMLNALVLRDAIWIRSGREQQVFLDKSLAEFEQLYSTWYNKGYRLIMQEAYSNRGQVYFSGIFIKSPNEQFVTWSKSLDELESLNNQWAPKGFTMVHQQTYTHNGKPFYNAIWNKSEIKNIRVNRKSFAELRKVYSDQYKNSYRLVQLQSHYLNGKLLYDAIWAPGDKRQIFSWDMYNEQADATNIINQSRRMEPMIITVR